MDPLEAHSTAQETFARVLAGVASDQYGLRTPCEEWTVRDLLDHVVGGNNRTAAGHPGTAVGDPELDGLVEGADPVELFRASAARAQSTFGAAGGLDRTYELPFGSLPGSVVIGMRTTDLLVHAWDLAAATGQDTDLEPELARRVPRDGTRTAAGVLPGARAPVRGGAGVPARATGRRSVGRLHGPPRSYALNSPTVRIGSRAGRTSVTSHLSLTGT